MIRLFRVFVPTSVIALILSEVALLIAVFILATVLIIPTDPVIYLVYEGGFTKIFLVVSSVLLGLYFQDMYADLHIRSRIVLFQQLSFVVGLTFFFQALLTYINPSLMMSRWVMIFASAVLLLAMPLWRMAFTGVVWKAIGGDRILFVGTNNDALDIARRITERPDLGLSCVGFLDNARPKGEQLDGGEVLGGISCLRDVVANVRPNRIIVGMSERRQALPVYDLLDLRFSGIRIEEAATLFESAFGRVSTRDLRPSQLIFTAELGPQPHNLQLQSIYSTVLAFIGLVILSPVMLLVALAVRFTSPGPILFRQTRAGMNGRPFTLYKFRSMRTDAEAQTGAVWAKRNDPRVTPIGKYLRSYRLDELPQLWNVLKGEMSIVGPRPERPEFVRTLQEKIPFYRQRHSVRPGITGWAQINYKYGETLEDAIIKLEFDLYYIKNLSPSLDLYIILNTFKVMLGQLGH
ncbi:MAG TPA: sugar transferase [Bryobacteraceae bacterium]|jgi:exopolysaccharide biosynthesis polyprenyl glycosylphosphotransferase|nr:sugar transferase [Bryobacteraceae bacterium]